MQGQWHKSPAREYCVFLSTVAGLTTSFFADEQFLQGIRMKVDFVRHFTATQAWNLRWSFSDVPRLSGGVSWGVTEVLSAVTSQGHRGSWLPDVRERRLRSARHPGVAAESQMVLASGGARMDLPRSDVMVVMVLGLLVPPSSEQGPALARGLVNSFYIPYVQRGFPGGTAAMVCPAFCGQGLRSCSPWFGAEVDAEVLGPFGSLPLHTAAVFCRGRI